MTVTDEMLMAFADAALDAEQAQMVALAIADDPALAARVEVFRQTRVVASAVPLPPVPDALRERVLQMAARHAQAAAPEPAPEPAPAPAPAASPAPQPLSNVVPLAARRPRAPLWQPALAASIALAIGLGIGAFGFGEPGGMLHVAALDDAAIVENLGSVASGNRVTLPSGGLMTVVASFADGDGALCREFEHDRPDGRTLVSVACNAAGAWDVRLAVDTAAAGSDGYAPASSLDTLDAYLSAIEAGAPLDPAAEAEALATLN